MNTTEKTVKQLMKVGSDYEMVSVDVYTYENGIVQTVHEYGKAQGTNYANALFRSLNMDVDVPHFNETAIYSLRLFDILKEDFRNTAFDDIVTILKNVNTREYEITLDTITLKVNSSDATVTWLTTSGHEVKFELAFLEGEWYITYTQLGDDVSENFYPYLNELLRKVSTTSIYEHDKFVK